MTKIIALLKGIKPNRVAAYLTVAAGLATAVAPAVADLDTSSSATVAVGFVGIVAVADRFLKGAQAQEHRDDHVALLERQGAVPTATQA